MTPIERYQRDLQRSDFVRDSAQADAVERLQALYLQLQSGGRQHGWWQRLRAVVGGAPKRRSAPRGLYFWGGVGRGKTYLMDNFFESLPFEQKRRFHFHRFMRRVHAELKRQAGRKNPLIAVADKLAGEARVICFDEFFVTDITDAMLLGGLMTELFGRGVTLVATSNIAPDGLYQNGLQRQRFLPAIALIKQHCEVVNVDGGTDYRLRTLEQAPLYHSPLGPSADQAMLTMFRQLVPAEGEIREAVRLEVENRVILCRYKAEDIAWFDFAQLCDGPRSQNDYIELAREFHAVLVSDVPQMGRGNDDAARRFVNMIDEFYDRQVKVIVSAAVPLLDLYSGGRLEFEFQRTASRLLEMQSHEYLARPHRP
ncbi:cell division protein ZapE [Gammaproteobacteria bacterium LSUCC0057]|uniref:Cell division protein ZapE n=1 Tax=Gammaproteobacteria bacterium LSUCC0057 TaxID=2559237 RepID=A0A4Y8UFS7_9GAMM|nr:cell division protein ZapE [Gammaproteobacteria bacterium LSUCC0057]